MNYAGPSKPIRECSKSCLAVALIAPVMPQVYLRVIPGRKSRSPGAGTVADVFRPSAQLPQAQHFGYDQDYEPLERHAG